MEKSPTLEWKYPMNPSAVRGMPTHLSHNQTGNKFTYPSQENAVIRDVKNLRNGYWSFELHSKPVTMVHFSSQGDRVISGDEIGYVHVWNSDHPTLMSSWDFQGLLGMVHDAAFNDEGDRAAIVGEVAGGKLGKALNVNMKKVDNEITGHATRTLSVAFKGNRPYKLYTCSEDNTVNVYAAPPQVNLLKTLKGHKGFVNCVRVAPDNKHYLSCSADKSITIYSVETDEVIKHIENAHGGSVYSLAWFDDSSKFASCSSDKTVKIWSTDGALISTLNVAAKPAVDDMQMGVVKIAGYLVSLSLNGVLNFWSDGTLAQASVPQPDYCIYGHNKPIIISKLQGTKITSVDNSGRVLVFQDEASYPTSFVLGSDITHGEISNCGKQLLSCFGDNLMNTDLESLKPGPKIKVSGNINDTKFGAEGQLLAVTNKNLLVVHQGGANKEIKLPEEGTAVGHLNGQAFVGTKRGQLLQVDIASGTVKELAQVGSSKITRIVPGNKKDIIAVGCSNGLLAFYSLNEKCFISQDLKYHNMPITCVQFNEDDTRCLSSAYEKDVHYWDLQKFKNLLKIENVSRICVGSIQLFPEGFYSFGADACVKRWSIPFI